MNTGAAIFYTEDTLSLHIFQTVFKIEGIVALTIKGG